MKNFLSIICLLFAINSYSQSVSGTVFDEKKQPLAGANIYFDGTTIATISDENGNFVLTSFGKINSLLAISYMGYQTQYISNVTSDPLKIILTEANNTLNEVVIKKDKFSRKEKMQLFRDEFLGRTDNAKLCVIANEDAIHFRYDIASKTMKAFSNVPLQISNPSLGYKIVYELVNFEVQFHSETLEPTTIIRSFYAGLSYFTIDRNSEFVLKNRAKSYQGSQLHFFRSLVNDQLFNENFKLFKKNRTIKQSKMFGISDANDYKKVQISSNLKKDLDSDFKETIYVLYGHNQSSIVFLTHTFYVDKFGNNSNIEDIIFTGDFSFRKVGDMLPMNYGIE
jgi:hypothetical protein